MKIRINRGTYNYLETLSKTDHMREPIIANSTGLLLAVSVGFLLAACSGSDSAGHNTGKRPAHNVHVATVEHGSLDQSIIASGTLQPRQQVRIVNEEAGKIISLPKFEGDRVDKDEMLVTLDNRLLAAQLRKATASLAQKQAELKRLIKLIASKHASEDELSKASAAVEIALADKQLQHSRLQHTTIAAPFSGIISKRLFEPGDVVPLHSHILTLYEPKKLVVKVELSENVLPLINFGDTASVRVLAFGEARHSGRITRIHPYIDTDTHKGTVEITVNNLPANTAPGQLCVVTFSSSLKQRMLLPLSAVRHDSRGAYVYSIDANNKINRTNIITASRSDSTIEVSSGLDIGDRVVSRGFLGLHTGQSVVINISE